MAKNYWVVGIKDSGNNDVFNDTKEGIILSTYENHDCGDMTMDEMLKTKDWQEMVEDYSDYRTMYILSDQEAVDFVNEPMCINHNTFYNLKRKLADSSIIDEFECNTCGLETATLDWNGDRHLCEDCVKDLEG